MSFRIIKPKERKENLEMPRKEIYPRFSIGLEHLPEAKKWEIGKEYILGLKLEMTGITIEENYSNVSFEVKAIEAEKSVKDMSKKAFKNLQTKVMSGKV